MILAVLFANTDGNILIERFHGVPAEERLHWRSFLVKLGTENLKGAKNEELFVASHKSVYIVYTILGDVYIYVVGKDEYDELALAEVIFAITSAVKDVCKSPLTERHFLDRYGKVCLCLDEIVWKVRNYSMHVFWWLYALAEYENQISSHRFILSILVMAERNTLSVCKLVPRVG